MIFFFFSSRRRHTRLTCDWSSDVCSSDLRRDPGGLASGAPHRTDTVIGGGGDWVVIERGGRPSDGADGDNGDPGGHQRGGRGGLGDVRDARDGGTHRVVSRRVAEPDEDLFAVRPPAD